MFELNNVKNKAILARLPSKMESWVQRWEPRTNAFCDFSLHLCKVLRLPRKIDARSYDVPHLSRKIISANLKIWCSKMQPFSGNQRPDLLTSLMNMSFVLRLPCEMHLWRSSSNAPRLPSFLEMPQTLTFCSLLPRCTIPCACHAKRHLNVQKCSVPLSFLHFWLGNMHRATTACTFDIWTSKSGPRMVCFVHFDFEMCFAPQRRALFRYLNFQKWSDHGVLCTFWLKCASRHNGRALFRHLNFQKRSDTEVFCTFSLRNVLRATTACTFSSLIWLAGSAPAALASLLFDPPEPQIIGKTHVSRFSYFFAHLHLLLTLSLLLFSLLIFLFSLPLPYSAFHLSILSEVWLLNFLRIFAGTQFKCGSRGVGHGSIKPAWMFQTTWLLWQHFFVPPTFLFLSGMDVQKCSILSIRHSGMVPIYKQSLTVLCRPVRLLKSPSLLPGFGPPRSFRPKVWTRSGHRPFQCPKHPF